MQTHRVNLSIFSLITVDETEAVRPEVKDGLKMRLQTMIECKVAPGYKHFCSYGEFMISKQIKAIKEETVPATMDALSPGTSCFI